MSGRECRRVVVPPVCSSGKVSYRQQGSAVRALQAIAMARAQEAVHQGSGEWPRSAYRCAECGWFHLTHFDDGIRPG